MPEGISLVAQSTTTAYPTDSKERERDQRNRRKEMGLEVKENKEKVFKGKDHHDDCGDDLSSLGPDLMVIVGLTARYRLDSDEELTDQRLNRQMRSRHVYPKAQTDDTPRPGRDPRAAPPKNSTCPGRKHCRASDDWEHSREIGQRSYSYDDP